MSTINVGTDTLFIRDSGGIQYSTDNLIWTLITAWPVTIQNLNVGTTLVVSFVTDITLTTASQYFICGSPDIQIGDRELRPDGTVPIVYVDAVVNYPGFVQNGSVGGDGNNSVSVLNLSIVAVNGTTLTMGGGWIGHAYFGKGTTDTHVLNCSSSGVINGGGILGDYAENVTLTGCSSNGAIEQAGAGGIVGQYVKSVTLQSCWSTGAIIGDGAGGIVGSLSESVQVLNCYSEGDLIGNNTGGIVGSNAGEVSAVITNCYSRGNIEGGNAGGICGSLAPGSGTYSVSITNCYSSGNLANSVPNVNGGICGLLLPYNTGTVDLTITNCYTSGTVVIPTGYIIANVTAINGSNAAPSQYSLANNFSEAQANPPGGTWSNGNANTVLIGAPIGVSAVGTTWVNSSGVDQPYELGAMGYSPYLLPIVSGNSLVRTFSQTIAAGGASNAAIKPDLGGNYRLLEITGGDEASRGLITVNGITGAISAPISTVPGTYTIYVRNVGSYNITMFELTVTSGGGGGNFLVVPACCDTLPLIRPSPATNNSSEVITADRGGKVIVRNVNTYYDAIANKSVTYLAKPVFATYREYMEYLQGQ